VIAAFDAPRDPVVAAWGRQVPALLHARLTALPGVRARLAIDTPRPRAPRAPGELLLEGTVEGGEEVRLVARLVRGAEGETLLARAESFSARELFRRLEALAADVARAIGLELPPPEPARAALATSYTALRDWLRAIDLSEEPDLPLELEDRRRKLEWLLLAVEADPSFAPAADALLEAGLKAHERGLVRESRRALELLARLSPRDPRAVYVLGELALAHGLADEAAAQFRRCLARDAAHPGAAFRLGLFADEEGDREAAKGYFKTAGEAPGGRPEALLLLGILCAEDGERDLARRAFTGACRLDPEGKVGDLARFELTRAEPGEGGDPVGSLATRTLATIADGALAVAPAPAGKPSRRRGGGARRR
jgi:tetratricopeptide (TPR) repeat protein